MAVSQSMRRKAYAPKPMDPGQAVTWTVRIDGHYAVPPHYENGDYRGGTGWIDAVEYSRQGIIWSPGSSASTWWVIPDDSPSDAVLIRRAGKRDYRDTEGTFFEVPTVWHEMIRRAENVRSRGIFPVIERTEQSYRSDFRGFRESVPEHTVVWHTDPECPGAAGKQAFTSDRDGHARGYFTPDYRPWDPFEVARVLMGLVTIGCSPTPFCATCILLDDSLKSQHSCAAVTA